MRVLALALVAHALLKEPTKSSKPAFTPPTEQKEPTKSTKPVFTPPAEKEHALVTEPTKSTKPVFKPPTEQKEPTKSTKPVFTPPAEKEHALVTEPTKSNKPVFKPPTEQKEPTKSTKPVFTPPAEKAATLVKESATTVEKAEEPDDVKQVLLFNQWIEKLKAQKVAEEPAAEGRMEKDETVMDKVDAMLQDMCEGRENAPAECDKFKEQITELHDTVAEHHEEHAKAEEDPKPSVEPGKAEAELSTETKVTLKDVVEHEPVITRIPSAAPPKSMAALVALLSLVFLHA